MDTSLLLKCAFEHEFLGTLCLVLKMKHWFPECLTSPWNDDEIAKKNPFFAQVWYPNHHEEEAKFYPNDCYTDIP